MKKTAFVFSLAAATAFFCVVDPALAGVLTITAGPTFTPDSVLTNNTIQIDTTLGDDTLVRLDGGATVTPDSTNMVQVNLSGTFTADAGDVFSGSYSLVADLNLDAPVNYTLTGTVTILGFPVPFEVTGTIMPGLHEYTGSFVAPAFPTSDAGNFSASLILDFSPANAPAAAAGTLDLDLQQVDLKLDPEPASVIEPSLQQNISTRADIGTGDNVLIGGFIITGTESKLVVLRGLGPSLTGRIGTASALADPMIELRDSTGAIVDTNDNWMDLSADDQMVLTDNALDPMVDSEAALVEHLDPGEYTVIVNGVGDTTGVGLVEAYDLDNGSTDSQLANISARGAVGTGDNVMIGGFILGAGGGGASEIVVRGLGPSLADHNVSGVLADPTIDLVDVNGDTIATNDNWMDDPNMQRVLDFDLAPTNDSEAAIYDVLPPGNYTVILRGVDATTGVGQVESYKVDSSTLLAR